MANLQSLTCRVNFPLLSMCLAQHRYPVAIRPHGRGARRLDAYLCADHTDVPIAERFLSEDERVVIADRRAAGLSIRAIAVELGRNPSTVSREIRRTAIR